MKNALIGIATLVCATTAHGANLQEMSAMTEDMVTRAAEHYANVGREQAEIDFNKKTEEWFADQYFLHMFGMGADGMVWADNVWPEFIGTDFSDAADFNGIQFGQEILANTPTDGSALRVELQFMNPDSGELSPSVGHCVRPDPGNILCSWTNG